MKPIKPHTIRDELAMRLKVYWRVYRKFQESYNAVLGIGRPLKKQDKFFTGYSCRGCHYTNGIKDK